MIKNLQTIGLIGLVLSAPPAIFHWLMGEAFGGSETRSDKLVMYAPFVFLILTIVCWIENTPDDNKE